MAGCTALGREGWKFIGWSLSSGDNNNLISASDLLNIEGLISETDLDGVYQDYYLDLYAQWELRQVKVTFDPKDPSNTNTNTASVSESSRTLTFGDPYGTTTNPLPTPTLTGYTFGGWYTSDDVHIESSNNCDQYITFSNLTSGSEADCATPGTITLHAKWTPNTYTVAFYANTPESSLTPSVTIGDPAQTIESANIKFDSKYEDIYDTDPDETYGKLPTASCDGYVFRGWFIKIDGALHHEITADSVYKYANSENPNLKLYAKWEKKISVQDGAITFEPVRCKNEDNGKITVSGASGVITGGDVSTNSGYKVKLQKASDKTQIGDVQDYTSSGVVFSNLEPGTYQVVVFHIKDDPGHQHGDAGECSFTSDNITINEPEKVLAFTEDPEATEATCLAYGKIEVDWEGGNGDGQYTLSWIGTYTSVSGSVNTTSTHYIIDNLDPDQYTITVKDHKGCQPDSKLVSLTKESKTITIGNYTADEACLGALFHTSPDHNASGNNFPNGTQYTWETPHPNGVTGNFSAETLQTDIHGTPVSVSGDNPYVEFTVTPYYGTCHGNPFTVTVPVGSTACSNVEIAVDPISSQCAGNTVNLVAHFTIDGVAPEDDTYTVSWYWPDSLPKVHSGCQDGMDNFTFAIPSTPCVANYLYTIVFKDADGKQKSFVGTVPVNVGNWQSQLVDRRETNPVNCVSALPKKSEIVLPEVTASCSENLEIKCVDSTTVPYPIVCDGKAIYTFQYKDCSGAYKDWHDTVYVAKETNKPQFTNDMLENVAAEKDKDGDCKFKVPNIVKKISATMVSDGCSTPFDKLSITQDLPVGMEITQNRDVKITVTDQCGNKEDATVTVIIPEKPKITQFEADPPITCYGKPTSITFKVSKVAYNTVFVLKKNDEAVALIPDYTVAEDIIGDTIIKVPNCGVGAYTLIVTDSNGCDVTQSITLTQPDELEVHVDTIPTPVCPGKPAALAASAFGGVRPYTYKWSTTEEQSSISVTPTPDAHTYTVTVTDKNGCPKAQEIVVNLHDTLVPVVKGLEPICVNTSLDKPKLTLEVEQTGYTYKWTLGDNENGIVNGSSTGRVFTASWTTASTKNVYLEVTDPVNHCVSRVKKTVTVNNVPAVKIASDNADNVFCQSSDLHTLTATVTTGTKAPYTYDWDGDEMTLSNQTQSSDGTVSTIKAQLPTEYSSSQSVSVTVTDDNGCSVKDELSIEVENPQVTIDNIDIYNHNNNDNTDVLLTNNVVCYGTTVKLVADTSNVVGTPTITWKYWKPSNDPDVVPEPNEVSSSTDHPLLRNLTDTTKFELTVTATVGSCPKSATKDTVVKVLPEFKAGTINAGNLSQQVCYGTPDEDITSIVVTPAQGGQIPYEYRWYHSYNGSDPVLVDDSIAATFTPKGYSEYPGTHTFTREAKDAACDDWTPSTGSYVLTVDEPFSAGAISTTGQSVCYKGDVNAIGNDENASGAHGTITYTWLHKLADDETWTLIDTAPHTPTFTPTSYNLIPGRHYFTRVATNGACNVKDTTDNPYLLQVQEELELTIPEVEEICAKPSDNSSLDNNVLTLTETAGTTTNYTYSWTVGEANANISGANTQTVNVSWPESGTGHLTLEVTMKDQPYCVYRKSVVVTVDTVPVPTISGAGAVCQNSPVTLTVTPDDLTTYHWTSFGGGTATAGATDNVKDVSWTDPGNHTVEVKVTDGNGCSANATKTVLVNALPILNCETTPADCNGGTNGVITASVVNPVSTLTYTFTLDGDDDNANSSGLFTGLSASTAPHHTVTVTDGNGCQAEKTNVVVGQKAGFDLSITELNNVSCSNDNGSVTIVAEPTLTNNLTYHFTLHNNTSDEDVANGYHPYTYTFDHLSKGSYTVNVTGVDGCPGSLPFEIGLDNDLEFTSVPTVSPKCSGDHFEVSPVVNLENTTYSWAIPGGGTVSDPAKVYGDLVNEGTTIETITYHVTATNNVICKAETDITVNVWPAVTVEPFSGNVTVCPEVREVALEAQFNHVMSNDNNTVTWTFNGEVYAEHPSMVATENLLADDVNVTLPDAYDVTYPYTVNFTDGVCSASAQGTVTVPAKLEMAVDNVKMISCRYRKDGEVKLHANGGTSPYKFTLHINNPAYGSDSIQNNVTTTAEFGHLYLPEDRQNGTTDDGDMIHYGFYAVTIEDYNGCLINDNVRVWAPDTMVWLYVPDPISLCCNSGETIDITVGPGGIINPTPKLSQLLTFQSGKTPTYFTGETVGVGSYNYSLQAYDVCKSKGTSLKKSIKVTVYANPSITFHLDNNEEDFSVQTICSGNPIQNIQIDSSYAKIDSVPGLPQGVSYANGVISGTPASVSKDTTYHFTVYATSEYASNDFAGCGSVTLTGSITVHPAPTVTLVATPESCTGGDGTITATYQNGVTSHNRAFIALDNGAAEEKGKNDDTQTYSGLSAGEHSVTVWLAVHNPVIDDYEQGCSATATIDVPLTSPYNGENPYVFSPITTPNICCGSAFTATPTAPTFGDYTTTYKWSAPTGNVTGGAASATTTETNVNGTLSNGGTSVQNAVYTVTPTTGNVCEGPAFTVTVPVNPTVVMNRPASQTVCSDSTIAAVVFGTPITDGSMSYSWTRTNTTGITGLDESGTGNIAATALKNTTTEAQTTTITVTPTYKDSPHSTVSCTGDTVKFTITVNPEVLLSADVVEQTKTYGTAIDDVTLTFSSHATLTHTTLPAGLTFTNNTLSGTPTAAGDHIVTFTATSTQEPNCGKKELTVTIHVEKALLTVTTQDNTKVYGQSDPQPLTTATIDGLVNNDTEAAIRELLQLSFSRATGENVGEYLISATGNPLNNYTVTYQNTGKLSITKATVTVKAVAQTKTYGAADPTLTATVSGLQHNDAASVITYTVSRVAGENVGEYVITPIGAAVQGNYTVTYDTAKFTITRADLTVKADNKTKPFGTADPTLTATVSGLVNGDAANAISYTLSRAEANTTAGENAGTYVITPTGAAVQGNYNVTYETGTLTITPINITVTVTGNTAVVAYTGSTQSVTGYTAVADNSNYDVSHVVYTGTAIAEGVGSANGDATYPMTLNLNQFSNNDPNYNVTFSKVDGWLRIVPEGTVIVNITGHTLTTNYDAQAHSVSGYDVEIVAPSNTTYTTANFTFNGQASLNKTDAGVYSMGLTAAQFVNTNTNVDNVIFNVTDGKLTINKVNAEVTISGNHDSRLYDGAEHTIADYVVSNITPAFYTESDFTFSGTATATRTNAGTTYMGLADNQFTNMNPNFEHVTFHVTDGYQTIQPIQVAVTVTGHTKMHEYTTELQKVTGYEMVSNSALFSKDYVVFSGDSTASGTTVGTYPMGLLASQFSYNNPNLQVTFTVNDGWLEIVQAGIVIVNITGHTDTKDYNCNEQSVSGYEVEIGGVSDDPVPVSYATIYKENYFSLVSTATATAKGTNAGTYYMGLDATKFENNNDQFDVQFHVTDGSLTIKKVNASVTITGKTVEVTYNGAAHTVMGYSVSNAQPTCYNTDYIHFTGSVADSTATRTDFGTTDMNLVPGLFQNTNPNFEVVTFTVVNGKMTVNKASMDITVNGSNTSRVYTGQLQTYIGAAEATSSNTGFNAAKFGYSGNTTVSGTAAGNYTMVLSSSSCSYNDANYNVNWTIGDPVKLTITKAHITLECPNVNDLTKVYDGSELKPEATAHGVYTQDDNNIKIEYSTDGSAWNTTAPGITNVGSQHVYVRASNVNYDTVTCDYTLNITRKAVTITAKDANKTYDGSALTQSQFTASALEEGDDHTFVVAMTPASTITNAGTQPNVIATVDNVPVTTGTPTTVGNYTVTTVNGTLTVTKAGITLTCPSGNNLTQVYNGSELHPAATVEDVYNNDAIKIEYSKDGGNTWSETVAGITDVGTQSVKVRASNANYDTARCEYTLTVNPKAVTITANNADKTYDGTALTEGGFTATALEEGDTHTFTVAMTSASTITEVGTQPNVIATVDNVPVTTGTPTTVGNYTVTTVNGTLTVTKAGITLTCPSGNNLTQVYNGSELHPAATATGVNNDVIKIEYSKDGGNTWSETVAGITNVGTQLVNVRASNANYDTVTNQYTLQVTRASITIKADGKSKIYDNDASTDPGLTATVTGKPANGVDPVYGLNRVAGQGVDEYVISVTAETSLNPNYTVTVDTGLFKITPAAIMIKANGKTKVYDNDASTDPELTATITGKPANGVDPVYSLSRAGDQNVGEYVITVTAEATSNPNYTVTVDTGLFKITPAALTIKVNTEKVYDASPLVTSFGNDGVSIEGNASGAQLTAGVVTTNGSTVGDYTYADNAVTITTPFAMSDGISNYTVSYDITMKIKENELTMYCPVNQADTQKVYDGTPISYTVSAVAGSSSALVEYSTDNLNWSSTTVPSRTDVGETVVYVRASADNYAMKYCHFTLKVTPKPVTVTITGNHDSKPYDATPHTVEGYTATANSTLYKVNGDNPDFGLKAGQAASAMRTIVGTTTMGLTTNKFENHNDNFDVTFAIAADGYMTITKATLTITANDQTRPYTATAQGEANATYTSASDLSAKVSVNGLQGNDVLTRITLNGQETNAGVYTNKILPSDAVLGNATTTGNYDITYQAGKLTIDKATATVAANSLSKTYGDADPTLTAQVTGVYGTDVLNYTLSRQTGENVGPYPISVNLGNNPNYEVNVQGGTFTINQRPLTITVNTNKYYDGNALVTNYDNDGVTIEGNVGDAHLTAGKVTTNGTVVGTYTNASNATNTVTINTPFAMSDGISNYSVTTNITMEIKKNVITMTCTDTAKTYDNISFNHPIPATVTTGETVTVQYSTDNTSWSGTAPSMTDFGSQTVYVRATADNYEPKTCQYNMTVNKRYVKIITFGGIHLYDGNSFNIPNNYTIEGDGFLEADVVASSFQTPATVTELGTCVTDTIIYETTSSFKANDYNIEYQLGQLCISGNAPITITSASVNPNAPIYYDGLLHGTEPQYRTYVVTYDGTPMPTVEGSNGLKFKLPAGDTVTITPTFTGVTFFDDVNDTVKNNVFTYTITHDAFYVGTRTVNYGTVNITKRPITFTIDPSLASKPYDGTILSVNASALTVGGQGLATTDAVTAGVVKTENYVVGEYTCAEGGFQVGVDGVAIKEGFVVTHSNGHNSTSSYEPKFNVKLAIDPITNFECPAAQTFTLVEGTSQMSLTGSQLGVPTLEGGAAIPPYVTVSSNVADITFTEGDHDVTWTFSDANGFEMATCTQTVTVQYAPCDGVNGYPAKRIGSQCWLTENLRDAVGNDYHSYKDNNDNLTNFGYLYSWYTTVGVTEGANDAVPETLTADNGTQYVQGICPDGWAVPSMSDIAELSNYVGAASRLKDPSTQYWLPGYEGDTEGNTEFNARGAGRYNAANNRYEDLMTGFHFWAADATPGSISLLSACIAYHCDTLILTEPNQKNDRKSVRCVRKHVEP